jgi:hypothetical protein
LVETNSGATTPYKSEIYIIESGRIPGAESPCFVSDHELNLKLSWSAERLLTISYDEARIFTFTNFWSSQNVQDFQYIVELRLNPNSKTYSLPISDRRPFLPSD